MLGFTAALSPMLWDPSSLREISAALMTPWPCHQAAGPGHPAAHLPGSPRPVEDPLGVLRQVPSATGLCSPSYVARGRVAHQISQSPSRKNPLQLESDCATLEQAVHCLSCPTRSSTQKAHEGLPLCGPFMQAIGRERRRSSQRALPPLRGLTGSPRSTSVILVSTAGLSDGALQFLSCWSWHQDNLDEFHHNPDFEGREATRPGLLLPPHLTALPCSEDVGVALPPVHRGGTGYTYLSAWLHTEALHHLGPAPHFC